MILSHPQTPERCPCKAGTVPSSAGSKNRDKDEAESNPSPTVPLSNPPETQVNHSKGVSTPLEPEEGSEGSRGQRAELEGDFQYPASLRLNSNSPPPPPPTRTHVHFHRSSLGVFKLAQPALKYRTKHTVSILLVFMSSMVSMGDSPFRFSTLCSWGLL